MTAPDLLPCPFCGGKPYLANVAMAGCAYVVCTDCRLQTDDGSQERVTAAWNTRAPLAEALAVPEVKALVEVCRRIQPHLGAIICYASTMDEHEPNRIAHDFDAALRAIGEGNA